MNSVSNFISSAIYNRFTQSHEVQNIAIGIGCLSQGKHLLCDPDPSPAPSLIRKIGRKAAGVALLAGGILGLYNGAKPFVEASIDDLKSEFLFGQNPAPSIQEDPYEQAFKKATEVLYLSASSDVDYNEAFNPSTYNSLPRCLDAISKLQYKTIRHPFQICEEIRSASKKSPVQDLVIGSHGNMNAMGMSPTSQFKVFDQLPANCFDGLATTARIFLQSCSTGQFSLWRPNVAEWMSWISGREVIAPSYTIGGGTEECFTKFWSGRIDIRLKGPSVVAMGETEQYDWGNLIDYTRHFNTSTSWTERALFSVKMVAPTLLGAMAGWQTMRLGATVLQRSGAAAEWLIDQSATPTRTLAERVGLYNPDAAQILYGTTKRTSQILKATGKTTHQVMDKLIQPVSTLGNWALRKSISTAAKVALNLYNKMWRN